jgi:hypothetical protein|nr:MAG TPA: hypothetical protein [Caudoviricetes sp.]
MPLSTKAVAFQISTLMRFFERPGGFVETIIPQIVKKKSGRPESLPFLNCLSRSSKLIL